MSPSIYSEFTHKFSTNSLYLANYYSRYVLWDFRFCYHLQVYLFKKSRRMYEWKGMTYLSVLVFWVIKPYELEGRYPHFGETFSVFYKCSQCYNPENQQWHLHCHQNLKSHKGDKLFVTVKCTWKQRYVLLGLVWKFIS